MDDHEPATTVFAQVALEHVDALYGYAMTLTHDRAAAEDLVQETYLRAVRAFDRLAPDSNLKAWLFAIMRNAWLNELRHARSGPRFVAIEGEDAEGEAIGAAPIADPFALYARKEAHERIHAALASLPAHFREIVLLRDIEGFSYHEIAALLECPAGTVMSRLSRARRAMLRSYIPTA